MNEDFKKGIDSIKNIQMTRYEKDLVLKRILETKPQKVRSFWVNPVFYNYSFATLIILFVFVGGTSIYAEKALPGDLLYPVKTSFNEPLRAAITFDEIGQIEWEEEKIGRRLEEIESLSIQGRINEKTTQTIEENIDANLETLDKTIEKAQNRSERNDKTSKTQLKLQVQNEAHNKIIEKISQDKNENEKEKIKSLNDSVKKRIEKKIEDLEKRKKR